MPGLRFALFTPISPAEPGNGLAHRARFWQEVLAELGEVVTVHVPLAGDPRPGAAVVAPALATAEDRGPLPGHARRAPEHLGRAWAASTGGLDAALAVVLSDWTVPFALGALAGTAARLVVDRNDDDARFLRAQGAEDEAARHDALADDLGDRAELVVSAAGFGTTEAVPNSVVPAPGSSPRGPSSVIGMLGNFGYEPNAEGARWFVEEVLPAVVGAVPGATFVAAGPGSDDAVPGHGVGFVADLDAFYRSLAVAVVPLLHGSGTRIKALEAFAHAVPVVGTTIGLEGVGVRAGIDCLVADEPAWFAAAVVELLADADRGRALAEGALAEVVPRHARPPVVAATVERLREVLDRPGAPAFRRAAGLGAVETDDGVVVIDEPAGTVTHLNPAAAAVFALADGQSLDVLAAAFGEVFGCGDDEAARAVLAAASELERAGVLVRCRQVLDRE